MKYVIAILNSYNFEKKLFSVLFFLLIGFNLNYLSKKEFHNKWNVLSGYIVKDLDYVVNHYGLFVMTKNCHLSTVYKKLCQPSGRFYLFKWSGVRQPYQAGVLIKAINKSAVFQCLC